MTQHAFAIPNESRTAFRADVNAALVALAMQSSGATEPSTRYAYQLWADTTASVIKRRNAANSAWIVVRSLSETFVVSRASNTILGVSDHGKMFVATAGFTQTLTAAATLGDGWQVDYRVESGETIIFDPNSTENIDGVATKTVIGPAGGVIRCDASGFKTVGFDGNTTGNAATATLATTATSVPSATIAGIDLGIPSPAVAGKVIYVSDESGGAVLAFSDGSNWRRVTDRAIVS